MSLTLYTFWRSSAAYRVRIALNLKGLKAEHISVHLARGGGEQFLPDYQTVNPHALVPSLRDGDVTLSQSLAIIEYLNETHPEPPLVPGDAKSRARIRQIAQSIACDIHPLANLRVPKYLVEVMGMDKSVRAEWTKHWIEIGFAGLEAQLSNEKNTGQFCHGDEPTMADLCLVPQIYNARRFEVDLSAYPTLAQIDETANKLKAFQDAAPEAQADAVQ